MSPRYAVYLAPPADGALWAFGSTVIGYDAASGADLLPPSLAGFDAETWHALTGEPRRYGFHGTLKAPFRLAEGLDEADLFAAVAAFAAGYRPFELPPLDVQALGAFVALVPTVPVPALLDLAACAVVELDPMRAPLTPEEVARRRPDRLSARQMAYLERHGYPYVLEEFRFHMTLTGALDEPTCAHALNSLNEAYAASGAHLPVRIDDIAIYRQSEAGQCFRILHRAPLGGVEPPQDPAL
ncbi:DUF1045 domain-containing protein [Xanthobacter sp. DSM 24535]|uniref:DUF1045 domain-containing protein n=1 Tax=Roseixanthobacter psychrophilus TaxID=3119917 RepID=UPI00372C605B